MSWRDEAVRQLAEEGAGRKEDDGSGRALRIAEIPSRGEEVWSATRHREMDRAGTRRVFALWRVVSCGSSDQDGWRTELDLGGRKPFNDHHRSSTFWAEPKIA